LFLLMPFSHSKAAPAASDAKRIELKGGFPKIALMGNPNLDLIPYPEILFQGIGDQSFLGRIVMSPKLSE
jgi:hypothetical protein